MTSVKKHRKMCLQLFNAKIFNYNTIIIIIQSSNVIVMNVWFTGQLYRYKKINFLSLK